MSWDDPNSDPLGDVLDYASRWYTSYTLGDGAACVFTPIPMRRPVWPRIVLFPRLARLELRASMWCGLPLMQLEKLALRFRRYGLADRIRDVDFWLRHRG